jgi:hypothetical protein
LAAGKKAKCPKCAAVIELSGQAPPGARSAGPETGGGTLADLAKALQGSAPRRSWPLAAPQAAPAGSDSEEIIAVPPIGVQTPSNIPVRRPPAAMLSHKWQRTLAGLTRGATLALAALCLIIGIVGMIILVVIHLEYPLGLLLGLGVFLVMVILAVALVLAGLVGRQLLLLGSELSESMRRQEIRLDEMNERLE